MPILVHIPDTKYIDYLSHPLFIPSFLPCIHLWLPAPNALFYTHSYALGFPQFVPLLCSYWGKLSYPFPPIMPMLTLHSIVFVSFAQVINTHTVCAPLAWLLSIVFVSFAQATIPCTINHTHSLILWIVSVHLVEASVIVQIQHVTKWHKAGQAHIPGGFQPGTI